LEKLLKLITVKHPPHNATSIFTHTTLWRAIPSYTSYRFTALKFQWTNCRCCEPTW